MKKEKTVHIFITKYEFLKKAESLGMTEEQFIDIYLNKVQNPDLTKKEDVIDFAKHIFHPTQEDIENDKKYMEDTFTKYSKYGLSEEFHQIKLSSISPFKEFLEG